MKRSIICALCSILMILRSCSLSPADGPDASDAPEDLFTSVSACDPESAETSGPESIDASETEDEETEEREVINYNNLKGIWVSQFDMADVYVKNGAQRGESEARVIIKRIVSTIYEKGFNTVFLQIRPYGDSFYKSDIYPSSRFVAGEYGKDPSYDVIELFIEECHALSISVQAWINPMRLTAPKEMEKISSEYAVRRMYDAGELVEYEGRLYLDPARGDALAMILDGAKEALETHGFDGLHIDDYFYPTQDESFDKATFASSGAKSLERFRINNINRLVKGLYDVTKSVDERLVFGVSPAGNLDSVLKKYSADVYEWCKTEGYVDYILPQLYFGLEHGVCPFEKEAEKWAGIIKSPSVSLYIGMTLGKAVAGHDGEEDKWAATQEGKREWIEHKDVLARCMAFLEKWGRSDGFCFFCLQYFIDPVSGEPNAKSAAEEAGITVYLTGGLS